MAPLHFTSLNLARTRLLPLILTGLWNSVRAASRKLTQMAENCLPEQGLSSNASTTTTGIQSSACQTSLKWRKLPLRIKNKVFRYLPPLTTGLRSSERALSRNLAQMAAKLPPGMRKIIEPQSSASSKTLLQWRKLPPGINMIKAFRLLPLLVSPGFRALLMPCRTSLKWQQIASQDERKLSDCFRSYWTRVSLRALSSVKPYGNDRKSPPRIELEKKNTQAAPATIPRLLSFELRRTLLKWQQIASLNEEKFRYH